SQPPVVSHSSTAVARDAPRENLMTSLPKERDLGRELLSLGREHWLGLIVSVGVGALAAAGTALVLPSYYRSGAAFQAEVPTQAPLSGTLAGLASQFGGLQLSSGQGNPQLLGELLNTDAVLRRVASAAMPWRGHTASLAEV